MATSVVVDRVRQASAPLARSPDSVAASARLEWIIRDAVALILLGGLVLRLGVVGLGNHALTFQPDEEANILRALSLSWADLSPHAYYYPALFWYLLFALYQLVFWLGREFAVFTGWMDVQRLFEHGGAILLFLLGRLLNVALGTATVGLVYLLGRRLFSSAHGLLAAGFLSATFLHVRDSALATLDAPLTFFVVLSLLGAAGILREGRPRDYVLAGAAAGLATATKYNGALVVVAVVLAHWLREARRGRPLLQIALSPRLLGAGLLCLLVFLALNPYLLLDRPTALRDLAWEWSYVHTGQYLDIGPGWRYHFTVSLRYGMGVVLLALAIAGIGRALWLRDVGGVFLVAFAGTFFLEMGSLRAIFVRYMTPLTPVLCLLAATALLSLPARFPLRARGWTIAGLSLLAVVEPLHASVAYARIVHHVDTRIQTYDFVRTALPPDTEYVTYGPSVTWRSTIPRFLPTMYAKADALTWPEVLALLKARKVSYLIVHHSDLDVFSPTIPDLERALHRSATLVREFTPYEPGTEPHPAYDRVDAHFFPIGRFRGVKRPGPLVRIYHLD